MNLLFLRAENGFRSLYKNICLYHSYYNGFFEPLSLWFASSQRNRYTKDTLDRGGSTKHTIIFLALRRMVGWIRFSLPWNHLHPQKKSSLKISAHMSSSFLKQTGRQTDWHLTTLEKIWLTITKQNIVFLNWIGGCEWDFKFQAIG